MANVGMAAVVPSYVFPLADKPLTTNVAGVMLPVIPVV